MLWRAFSQVKFYASLIVAMVGLSAASALIISQEPRETSGMREAAAQDAVREVFVLQSEITALQRKLGKEHPKVQELRARLDAHQATLKDLASFGVNASAGTQTSDVAKVQTEVLNEDVRPTETRIISQTTIPAKAYGVVVPDNSEEARAVRKAIEQMRSNESSDSEKAAARQQIIDTLGKQFDADMDQRGKKIEELEKQLTTLKEQLEKRKSAKERLIELRIELLQNEEEGLGFPNAWQQNWRSGSAISTAAGWPTFQSGAHGTYNLNVAPRVSGTVDPNYVLPSAAARPRAALPPVAPPAPATPAAPAYPSAPVARPAPATTVPARPAEPAGALIERF